MLYESMGCSKFSVALTLLLVGLFAAQTLGQVDFEQRKREENLFDKIMHYEGISMYDMKSKTQQTEPQRWFTYEEVNSYWENQAEDAIKLKLSRKPITGVAKNVILFLGDGMSIPTLMAARTYAGQLEGKPGEEGSLYWENFPFTGLSKTWCINKQVPDSACTSTAYLGGVKSILGTIGLNGRVVKGDCDTQVESNYVHSIAKWAQEKGKATGIVTTTRVTHASPGGAYAHVADRNWESDTDVASAGIDPRICRDIATQLVREEPGKNFKVILGGGRRNFLPNTTIDEEGDNGIRSDNVDLIREWSLDKHQKRAQYAYIWNRTSLFDVRDHPDNYDYVLGLFESSHLQYHLEGSPKTEPTLAEMTVAAIKMLRKSSEGFFLFVEGGRIDHAHHSAYATIALDETVELAKAVKAAREMTSELDTLVVVTSDHAHTMSVSGYPDRGNPINSIVYRLAADNLTYATLNYANGPGYQKPNADGSRYDPAKGDYNNPRYQSLGLAPMSSETHGGDDVAIFASGPWAHLFTGTMEQSNIPYIMGYASCINRSNFTACADHKQQGYLD